jgi:NAD(P)-dependent dehydrogenase (short-subunit alcohol dehydrogenase family)
MHDKVALVTGGSRGIGAATARLVAARGYRVVVNYLRNTDAAGALVAEIERQGAEATGVQADVSVEADVQRLFHEIDHRFGRLDALVNNAGIVDQYMRVEAMTAARVSRMLAVNVVGPFLCAREAIARMSITRGGRGGAIVNVSSGASRLGSPNEYVDYAASKGAIDTFTIGLAKELATDGIRVNAVRAGVTATDIHESTGKPDRIERIAPRNPMKRIAQPEEIAAAILWLLSDEASYVTGAVVDVTGGL